MCRLFAKVINVCDEMSTLDQYQHILVERIFLLERRVAKEEKAQPSVEGFASRIHRSRVFHCIGIGYSLCWMTKSDKNDFVLRFESFYQPHLSSWSQCRKFETGYPF
jgi:hypothetical protein